MESEAKVLLLHENPSLMNQCCALLNKQWPRSHTARLRSLEASCAELPTSFVLVRSSDAAVIGHAKISSLPNTPEGCFIESVLIEESLRGKGYGKLIMQKCEDYARLKGFKTAYLSTHDQQNFYTRLGYQLCQPVCHFGGTVKSNASGLLVKCSMTAIKDEGKVTSQGVASNLPSRGPPPPPLPLDNSLAKQPAKVYMKKSLLTK